MQQVSRETWLYTRVTYIETLGLNPQGVILHPNIAKKKRKKKGRNKQGQTAILKEPSKIINQTEESFCSNDPSNETSPASHKQHTI